MGESGRTVDELVEGQRYRLPDGVSVVVVGTMLPGVACELAGPKPWLWLAMADGAIVTFGATNGNGKKRQEATTATGWTVADLST